MAKQSRDDPALTDYLNEISITPLLTGDEEKTLAQRIENGDEEARQHFIRANLKLVIPIAMGCARRWGADPFHLIQQGNLGVIRAVKDFNWREGCKFSTYATGWIRSYVWRAPKDKSGMASLDSGFDTSSDGSDGANMLYYNEMSDPDAVSPRRFSENKSLRNLIVEALSILTPEERKIILMLSGLMDGINYSENDVAEKLGMRRETLRQKKEQALRKLRRHEGLIAFDKLFEQ